MAAQPRPENQTQLPPTDAPPCEGTPEAWSLLYGALPAFVVATCLLGLLGNLCVLSALLLPRRRRLSVAELYLANLAASDLVFVLGLPFWAENIGRRFHWPFGAPLCRVVNGVIKANLFVSIFLVVAISRDRSRALTDPVGSRGRRRRRGARAACALAWAAGGVLSVPTFLLRRVAPVPPLNVSACVLQLPHPGWHYARMVELNVLGFLLPLAAIVFFNGRVLAALRRRAGLRGARRGGPGGRKATALILALVAAFLLCWAPYHVFAFLDFLFQVGAARGCFWEEFIDLGLQAANFFAFLHCGLNPVIYVFAGGLFRARLRELYKRCAPGRPVAQAAAPRKGILRLFWRNESGEPGGLASLGIVSHVKEGLPGLVPGTWERP
ncbi:LOW QUALITY PROTEIN: B1 bradykinin receptor [Dasypus novemcinctus]|uniref:LOW QUALITY PROTEIN: B1 bradykinin receptor n=1 Tax=Dasypus novemcinctus TaxID=9361 RepID=UPI00265F0648|nr:LOW QUALITY PROTEIN: B1 bradykinin receptor [Dasypus novemcinctus]